MKYSRRQFLKQALVVPIVYALACDDKTPQNFPGGALTGRPIQKVLDDMIANYDGDNLSIIFGETTPAEDISSGLNISNGFQTAAPGFPPPQLRLDTEVIPEDPSYQRNMIVIGNQTLNLVIDSFVREYMPQGLQLPPPGIGVLQSYILLGGREAIAVMGMDPLDRKIGARVMSDVLNGNKSYDLNGNVVQVYGDLSNIQTDIIR